MKALVVGYGSIGARHARLLQGLNIETAVVSKRIVEFPVVFGDIAEAIKRFNPNYIIIANQTSEHIVTLNTLLGLQWSGNALIEKPLFHQKETIANSGRMNIFVAYNLRFHPVLYRLKELLKEERLLSITAYAGQYLPDWRPNRDYRLSYSSHKDEGGGVLRDLSHELDYLTWICGSWLTLTGLGGHYSSLETSADDFCSVMMQTVRCPSVNFQLNCLDRPGRREMVVVTDCHTYKIDFVKATLERDGSVESFKVNRDDTYLAQHKAVMENDWENLCSYEEGQAIVSMIDAVERSILSREWVHNEKIMHHLR
ncbi:Gfo/Idh/MocA family oxidoreductase [Paenibacillus sepulcri]|uniref:Gfo/Idh/MocA family oxidoreductase n=1 Tax=Paenibacillus sepulcri TaxID=359917 RepID=A0ABS7BV23_9BACL|nr:gfo/Idh/MocA family oxidoreductase [Paenibacillus sepulcri]